MELAGKTATGLRVPPETVEALGAGKRVPVVVTINGHSYRSTVAPYGGAYFLPLAAEHREAAGVKAGDEVSVDVEVDTAPREVTVPDDLAAALAAEPEASAFFAGLSYSNKRRIVLSLDDAKTPETRARRLAKAVENLKAGKV